MKKNYKLIGLLLFLVFPLIVFGQYKAKFKLSNFQQVNETYLEFDLELHNTGSQVFGLDNMQCRINFNPSIYGGQILVSAAKSRASTPQSTGLTGWYGGDGINDPLISQQITTAFNADVSGNVQGYLIISTGQIPDDGKIDLFQPGSFIKIARIKLLCTIGSGGSVKNLPFSELLHNIAFHPTLGNHIVNRVNAYDASNPLNVWKIGLANAITPVTTQTPVENLPQNNYLAGYSFTGTGNYSTTTLWNNATHTTITGYHVAPSSTNSAIINGNCTLDQNVTINNLYIKSGAVLTIPTGNTLTINGVLENAGTINANSGAINVSVNFNSNGGSAVTSIPAVYGGTIATLPTATKSGYFLAGWFTDAALTSEFIVNSTTVSLNMTLYAKWNVAPPAAFAVTGSGSYCQGTSGIPVGLLGSESGVNYQLYKDSNPHGTPVVGNGLAIDFGNHLAATYKVVATNTTTSATTNMTGSAIVIANALPVPTISGLASVCAGTTGVTYITESGMTGYTWVVSAGGSITTGSTTNSITVTWNAAGPKTVSVNYNNASNCKATVPTVKDVIVNSLTVPTINGLASVCAGTTGVTYSTESSMTSYTWVVSAGGTITAGSTTNSINVTWNTAGPQTVSVNYSNASSCTATSATVKEVTANALPVPTITGLASVCAGTMGVTYSTESSMTSYTWVVSPGGTITAGSTTNSITVTWNAAGPQTVSVNYNNALNCTATVPTVKDVTVNALPVLTINGLASVCAGTTGVAYTTESSMTGYTWVVSVGGTITAGSGTNSITVTWNAAGPQTVSVNYNNASNCTATVPTVKDVTVNSLPVPTITGLASVCAGTTGVTYTTESSMTGYTWVVSAGGTITAGSTTNSITVTWNAAGPKTVSVNYNNASNCTATVPTVKDVTVNSFTVPTINGLASVCAGTTGVTYSTESSMTSYTWVVSAGGTITAGSTTNSITVTWNAAGPQTVSVNYNNASNCTTTATVKEVTVNALPVPTITGLASVCAGTMGVTYSTESSMTNYTWVVSPGGTITAGSGTNSITVTWNAAGPQTVSVNYNNALNCTATAPTVKNVSINALVGSAGTITGQTSVCNGATSVSYSVPPIASATGYVWSVPTGATIASGANTNSITVDFNILNAVSGNVAVYGTNGCGNGTNASLTVTVNSIPSTPVVSVVSGTAVSNSNVGNQWYFSAKAGGAVAPILDATSQSYTPTLANETGWYLTTVTLTGCSSAISNKVYLIVLGTGMDKNGQVNVKIYSQDKNIFVYCSDKVNQIKIYNAVGSMIKIVDKKSDIHKISMIGNPEGCYIVSLIADRNVYSGKVILK